MSSGSSQRDTVVLVQVLVLVGVPCLLTPCALRPSKVWFCYALIAQPRDLSLRLAGEPLTFRSWPNPLQFLHTPSPARPVAGETA